MQQSPDEIFIKICKYVIVFLPVIIYLSFVLNNALNLPHMDDFDAILYFLNNYKPAPFGRKIAMLFAQHNEHRILMSRIVYAIYYHLTGTINFRNIIYLNFGIVLSVYFLLLHFLRKIFSNWFVIVAFVFSLCIFDLNGYENADFAMGGMQNYGIFLLFLGSMYCYSKDKKIYLLLAIALQILCVFSSGNGNVGAFLLTVYTFFGNNKLKKITSTACLLLFAPLYYYHYQQPQTHFFTLDPSKFVPFFLHAVGAHFGYAAGIIGGILLLVLLAVFFPLKGKKIRPECLPLVFLAAFILCSLGVMAIFRANLPMEGAYSSRYYIYSHLLVAIIFVFTLIKLQNSPKQLTLAVVFILVLLSCYRKNYDEGVKGFEYFHSCMKNQDFDYPVSAKPFAKEVTDESCRLNIYCIDKARAGVK